MAKWDKGGRIDDPMVALSFIVAGEPIFDGDKCQNAGWTQCWQVYEVIRRTRRGFLHIALPKSRKKPEAA